MGKNAEGTGSCLQGWIVTEGSGPRYTPLPNVGRAVSLVIGGRPPPTGHQNNVGLSGSLLPSPISALSPPFSDFSSHLQCPGYQFLTWLHLAVHMAGMAGPGA